MTGKEKKALALALVTPLLLIVPNILLNITDGYYMTAGEKILNIAGPLAVYYFITLGWKKTGGAVLCLIPVMVLAAFQIVLLDLYGESIIAVDMFLNVVTTDADEAGTLLANLMGAIGVVVALYLPPIVFGIIALVKGWKLPRAASRSKKSLIVCIILTVMAIGLKHGWLENIFPVNVTHNMITAVERTVQSKNYLNTSAEFTHNATLTPKEASDSMPTTLVLVIGETGRSGRWQLGGYDRETNPRLSKRTGVTYFGKAITESNTTHKSVPMMMSAVVPETFDSVMYYRSVIEAFNNAGYHTAYFSNQPPNGSYNQRFGEEADLTVFMQDVEGSTGLDRDLLGQVKNYLDTTKMAQRRLIVLHTYGNHFRYNERYPADEARFTPDAPMDAERSNREALWNAYDNATLQVDLLLDSLATLTTEQGGKSAIVYAADHGEDMYDDERERFLHASPVPTYYQLHVPMMVWMSEGMEETYPEMVSALKENAEKRVSPTESLYPTLLQLGGVATSYLNRAQAVTDTMFRSPRPIYLTDRNVTVTLEDSGVKKADLDALRERGIID